MSGDPMTIEGTGAPAGGRARAAKLPPGELAALRAKLDESIDAGLDWFAGRQTPDGYWAARLETNATMEAEWILALHFMGRRDHPVVPGMVKAILREQRADGSWQVYAGAPAGDVNATVESYAALRCAGMDKDAPELARARAWLLERDALRNVRVFTRYWLALIGEWPWTETPNIPPEVVHFAPWFPFSIYNFSSWARATLMPIAVLSAHRPVRPLPDPLDELFPRGRAAFDHSLPKKANAGFLDAFFLRTDKILHALQGVGIPPFRDKALARVVDWIVAHQDEDGVWGGIQPPWIYGLMALHTAGFGPEHPVMKNGLGALDDPRWRWEEDGAVYMQACTSPVWDTVLGLVAIADCEADDRYAPRVDKAVEWLLAQEVTHRGDWSVKVPEAEPGGWAFEYANAWYPDLDDTAVALMVLAEKKDDPAWVAKGIGGAIDRAVDWTFKMQCKNGGWAAFDKDNDRELLTKIPFCDFGEALDPPSVDVTAHVLEALAKLGYGRDHPSVARAVDFLKTEQEDDGSWFGRWGVNYIYGISCVLPALKEIGEDMRAPYVTRAADWLLDRQNPDGGWGESCASYMDPEMVGRGVSTASQTAWALMALIAVDRPEDRAAVERGCAWLTERQKDGEWDEPEFTGTGFPGYGAGARSRFQDPKFRDLLRQGPELSRAFMLRYHYYRHYFPLMALGRARKTLARHQNQ